MSHCALYLLDPKSGQTQVRREFDTYFSGNFVSNNMLCVCTTVTWLHVLKMFQPMDMDRVDNYSIMWETNINYNARFFLSFFCAIGLKIVRKKMWILCVLSGTKFQPDYYHLFSRNDCVFLGNMGNNVLFYYQNRGSVAYFTHDLYHLQVKNGRHNFGIKSILFFSFKNTKFRIEFGNKCTNFWENFNCEFGGEKKKKLPKMIALNASWMDKIKPEKRLHQLNIYAKYDRRPSIKT